MFTDRSTLELSAGKGGNGLVSWRREKYIPKGGPYGGDGGNGGSIIFKTSPHVYDLDAYRHVRRKLAQNGGEGGSACCQGKSGEDLILLVPCGTLVKDADTGEVIADLIENEQEFIVCQGGKGGRGNYHFRTSIHRAPTRCTPGTPGTSQKVELELKLIADVGFVGFPNAGKSTLLENVTDVKVKKAPYPFTTLFPNLGYVFFEDGTKILLADVPGIIEGAHVNKGLGLEFLRHIERTKVLVFIVDGSGIDDRHPLDDLKVLKDEISAYNPQLLEKPSLLVFNKIDTEEAQVLYLEEFMEKHSFDPKRVFSLSALTSFGTSSFLEELHALFSISR